jgi:hypothetical protein
MPNPPLGKVVAAACIREVEKCLREGFRPPGRSEPGRSAIEEAARRFRDPNTNEPISSSTFAGRLRTAKTLYGIEPDWSLWTPKVAISTIEPLSDRVRQLLKKGRKTWTREELSDQFDVGIGKIDAALAELRSAGVSVEIHEDQIGLSREIARSSPSIIDVTKFRGRMIRFGLTSDNHLGSKYERNDALDALFDIWHADGIETVYQLGNMIEGERHSKFDIHKHGLQDQVDYFIERWPRRPGIVTKFITGDDHEGWYVQDDGVNIGKFIEIAAREAGRDDLIFLGHMEHDIHLRAEHGQAVMRLMHGGGGGSYAMSYEAQKVVESFQGGEKPQVLLMGHNHKLGFFYPREVLTVMAGSTKDQDSFLRKKRIQSHIGGWTISFEQDTEGVIHRFTPTMHAFFDRTYYDNAWRYKWKPDAGNSPPEKKPVPKKVTRRTR